MDLKIVKERNNPSLFRVEIEAEASFYNEPTPKKEDLKKRIVGMKKSDEKLVVIKHIGGSFGTGKANVLAYVYKSEKELRDVEPKKKEKKKALAEGAEETKSLEEKKEETPEKEAD